MNFDVQMAATWKQSMIGEMENEIERAGFFILFPEDRNKTKTKIFIK